MNRRQLAEEAIDTSLTRAIEAADDRFDDATLEIDDPRASEEQQRAARTLLAFAHAGGSNRPGRRKTVPVPRGRTLGVYD